MTIKPTISGHGFHWCNTKRCRGKSPNCTLAKQAKLLSLLGTPEEKELVDGVDNSKLKELLVSGNPLVKQASTLSKLFKCSPSNKLIKELKELMSHKNLPMIETYIGTKTIFDLFEVRMKNPPVSEDEYNKAFNNFLKKNKDIKKSYLNTITHPSIEYYFKDDLDSGDMLEPIKIKEIIGDNHKDFKENIIEFTNNHFLGEAESSLHYHIDNIESGEMDRKIEDSEYTSKTLTHDLLAESLKYLHDVGLNTQLIDPSNITNARNKLDKLSKAIFKAYKMSKKNGTMIVEEMMPDELDIKNYSLS